MGRLESDDFAELSALAARAQDGDSGAYEQLLRRLYPFVGAVVRARLGGVVAVDDVVQECLLAVHKSLATYQPSRSIRPWIMAIIRYKLADHFRELARRKEEQLLENRHPVTDEGSSANLQDERAPHGAVDIGQLVGDLPAPLRRAIVLTKLDGLTSAEAALKEGITAEALRKRVSRAYKALAAAYAKMEKQDGEG